MQVFANCFYNKLQFFLSMKYRAASHGNIEALIKLGIAHLYNEGSKCLWEVVITVELAQCCVNCAYGELRFRYWKTYNTCFIASFSYRELALLQCILLGQKDCVCFWFSLSNLLKPCLFSMLRLRVLNTRNQLCVIFSLKNRWRKK